MAMAAILRILMTPSFLPAVTASPLLTAPTASKKGQTPQQPGLSKSRACLTLQPVSNCPPIYQQASN